MDLQSATGKEVITMIENPKYRQSPIDIQQSSVQFQDYRPFSFLGHEKLSISSGTLTATNTGSTIKLVAKPGTAFLEGGPLTVKYEFVEMHFHWGDLNNQTKVVGSEHTIDGTAFPLELHMVHRNVHDESINEALTHENGLCVLGFLFTMIEDNADIQTFGMDALTRVVQEFLVSPGEMFDQSVF